MALHEAYRSSVRFGRHRSSPFSQFIGNRNSLSKYFFQWLPLQRGFNITYLSVNNRLPGSRILSIEKETEASSGDDLCEVLWCIEADVAEGEILYITGDLETLGCWEPERAIPLSHCKDRSNLWMAETEVPYGANFSYNYFIKQCTGASCVIICRQGPEFSLSVPMSRQTSNKLQVRDLWVNSKIEIPPVFSWGTWLEIGDYPEQTNAMKKLPLSSDVLEVSHQSPERSQPTEEPWLQGLITFGVEDSAPKDLLDETLVSEVGLPKNLYEVIDKEVAEYSSKSSQTAKLVTTDILINSSVCTMQRVAILEDGKLVELLLEPLKHNVQCDSVYLGVLTKLVPHMGGAFVDIGISRPSLMEIKQNRAPFVYPPFHELVNGQEVNGFMSNEVNDALDVEEHYPAYNVRTLNDGFVDVDDVMKDDEQMDNDDSSSGHEAPLTNGAVGIADGEADFEDYDDEHVHSTEYGSVEDLFSVDTDGLNDTNLSEIFLQSLKENIEPHTDENKWDHVKKGTKVIVQVVKEGLGTKGPALTAYPTLRSRFWILSARCNRIGVSKKITGVERTRLRVIAKTLQPPGFGLTVRTVAANHSLEELQKDLEGLLTTWKGIIEHAKSAALAADEGVEDAVPVLLHRAMGQTLSVVQDYFNEKVNSMVVDSPRTYREVTSYLQEMAPDLCDRVLLYSKRTPIFDEYGVEEEIDSILSKRVPLVNGGSLVIEQTEALVSIDVNGGHGMLGQGTSQEKAVLDVNLAAAKQIARELRLRDIGGIIVVDFIDMVDESNKKLVYEEMKRSVERDRSLVKVSELSRHGLMEITRKRVRPSVSFMISEPCPCCQATGRVEALETSYSKIEHEICRRLASTNQKAEPENAKSWPRFVLRVDKNMFNYLTSGKRTKLAILSSSLKVWILLKVTRGFSRGTFEVRPFTEDMAGGEPQQPPIPRLRAAEGRPYIPRAKLTLFPVKKWKSRGK
ncbi:RNAse E/G-like protein isoform X2 [Wolffia australiana]